MPRKLFCEISPFTYRLSMEKEILKRHLKDYATAGKQGHQPRPCRQEH